ncbi:MAG: zinc ribbon domain-containing protein [Dehalococcoidia bacterium]|nr:zinc ribbon domain-containing protein [Dehalococcoidia bacterium]
MPIYEYRCGSCGRKVSVFVRSVASSCSPDCTACGSSDLQRIISAVAYHRSEADRLSETRDSDYNDPNFTKDNRNIGLWAKKRIQEMGGELPPQFDEIVEKGRSGKLLEEYESGIK